MPYAPQADWLFHVAQVFFLLSYIQWNLLFLRFALFFAFFTLGLWALLATDGWERTVAYNAVFCAINVAFLVYMLYQRRKISMTDEEEELYKHVFQKYGNFDRLEFKTFYNLGCDRVSDRGRHTRFVFVAWNAC
jgi:hypothetical protein